MTRLIVNGDDFGMCEGVTLGILKAHKEGILRSTTMMVNMPFASQAALMAKDYPNLGVGLHFTLTAGKPVLSPQEVPTLVDENGKFHSQHWHLENIKAQNDLLNYDEVYKELEAQLKLFIQLNGHLPDHVDSHHGSAFYPKVYLQTQKLIEAYDLPVRINTSTVESQYERPTFTRLFYDEGVTLEFFLNDLADMKNQDLVEMMCHPAFVDEYLYTNSSYNINRTKELSILCSTEVKNWIKDNNIHLINYKDLKKVNR